MKVMVLKEISEENRGKTHRNALWALFSALVCFLLLLNIEIGANIEEINFSLVIEVDNVDSFL